LNLAETFKMDRTSYTLSKDDLVKEMLEKAEFQGITMVQALTDREWAAVKCMRYQYFFNGSGVQDPYTWTLEDENHFHIVLMKGCDIVGYAHVQFWPDNRAALRIIVIEEALRNQGMGLQFLKHIERWLTHQNIKSLHMQSPPAAYGFYHKAGYVEMPFNDPDGHESDSQDTDMGKKLLNF
jgi:N-acetylglutamate synthase-like GNAT family acetyltransferase